MVIEGKQKELLDFIIDGHSYILVEAPAGTGKTFSCIQAAKCFWDNNMLQPHQKVLVLTFSRNARAQLIKELSKIPPNNFIHKHIDINNYHSFFKKYLDAYRDIIGISLPLIITDDSEYLEMLNSYADEQGMKLHKELNCEVLDDYSYENDTLLKLNHNQSKFDKVKTDSIIDFIETATQFTQSTGHICFAQFGAMVCKIISQSSGMAKAISHDYPILILDEYQDTNYYQECFVRAVLRYSKGLFFADKLQMIYEFRGSSNQRISELTLLYPAIKKLEFTEYYRYKDKPDLIEILTTIRSGGKLSYSKLVNGTCIVCEPYCNDNWERLSEKSAKSLTSKKKQCTILCSQIYYKTIRIITDLLKKHKSVAVLCRTNSIANRLAEKFFENNLTPRTISDTPDMARLNKQLKLCIKKDTAIKDKIPALLSIACLSTMRKMLADEDIDALTMLNSQSLSRKRKPLLKQLYAIIEPVLESRATSDVINVIRQILDMLSAEEHITINYPRKRYIEHCINTNDLTSELIDSIMLQRQYIDSFTDISPGLYITTIHQAKGKEFDCVFVVDVTSIMEDKNLLYVSHSRMKEQLYPVVVRYLGLQH